MKTFSQIKTKINETLNREIHDLMDHLDGQSFRGAGRADDFGRGGYNDPHHLSGRGQLLDVLIRKISQLGVENDGLAQEVAEKMGLDLGDSGGVQKLLKLLKCHALGIAQGDLPTTPEKVEVLAVAAQIAAHDIEQMEERPFAPEASEVKRAPREARTPPNQTANAIADPLGYANQGNLEIDEAAIRERLEAMREQYGLPELEEEDLLEDKTDRELKRGLESFIKDYRESKRSGNRKLANELRQVVMQVVAQKGLDSRRIAKLLDEGYDPGVQYQIALGEDITPVLKKIVANKQAAQVKFDNGRRRTIDLFTASAIISTHDALNKPNQEKLRRMLSKNEIEFARAANFALSSTSGKFRADPGRLK